MGLGNQEKILGNQESNFGKTGKRSWKVKKVGLGNQKRDFGKSGK